MKLLLPFGKIEATVPQTRKQILRNWQQAVEEFYDCYQQLDRQKRILTNCPTGQPAELMNAMRVELIRLTLETDELEFPSQLIDHTIRLRELTKRAQVSLWLAGSTAS